jgi:hypothetical protein
MLEKPADGDWLMWRRTFNGWGYSPLAQITPANVKGLRLVMAPIRATAKSPCTMRSTVINGASPESPRHLPSAR